MGRQDLVRPCSHKSPLIIFNFFLAKFANDLYVFLFGYQGGALLGG